MSLEGGREGDREGWRGREGGGEEGEGGREGGGGWGREGVREGREGREGGRGGRAGREGGRKGKGMREGRGDCYNPMEAQYLKNNHVTYYVIPQVGVYAAQQWYVITSDVTWDSHPPGRTD